MLKCAATATANVYRSKPLWKKVAARWQIYLLLIIPISYIVIFKYIPISGLIIAFKDYDFTKGILGSGWVGLKNFEKFFNSYKFKMVLTNTLTLSFYSLATFPVAVFFALLLNAFPLQRYKKIIQTTTYIPHFFSTVVMVGLIMQIINNRSGMYGSFYTLITGSTAPNLLANGAYFKHIYVLSDIWQHTGYSSIIYIAALSNVDQSLYEAARIDGASRFQLIKYIDFPSILPTVSIMLILSVGSIMNVGFEKVFLMQNSLNLNYSEVISTHVYKVGLASGINDYSLSTAIDMFNSLVNFTLLIIANFLSKKLDATGIF